MVATAYHPSGHFSSGENDDDSTCVLGAKWRLASLCNGCQIHITTDNCKQLDLRVTEQRKVT